MRKTSYRQAYDNSSRRGFLKRSAAVIAAIVVATPFGAEQSQAAKKSNKKQVRYQDAPKSGRKCADCRFFQADKKSCEVVEGKISPEGWCVRFVKK